MQDIRDMEKIARMMTGPKAPMPRPPKKKVPKQKKQKNK